jgi:hypothetical protein
MMFEIGLPYHRQARVWIDDTPPASFEADETIERVHPAGEAGFLPTRRVAVELFIPKGARVLYGLLGAEFRPSQSGELYVLVNALSSGGPLLDDPLLAPLLDEVRIGLPPSYVEAVLEGVTLVSASSLLPGTLLFQNAAHGVVSSCNAIFKVLSLTVVRLLMMNQIPTKEEDLLPHLQVEID